MEDVLKAIEKITEPVVESHDCRIVDLLFRREGRGRILRLFIERSDIREGVKSGITVDVCASVSRDLSLALDTSDIIDGPYTLEVSSAGLDRPLKKLEDFRRFNGSKIKIKTSVPIMKRRTFTGKITGVEQNSIFLLIKGDQEIEVPYDKIKKANLVPEIKWS